MYSICHAIETEFKAENYVGCMSYYGSFIESTIEFKLAYRIHFKEESSPEIEQTPLARSYKLQLDPDTGKYFCLSKG